MSTTNQILSSRLGADLCPLKLATLTRLEKREHLRATLATYPDRTDVLDPYSDPLIQHLNKAILDSQNGSIPLLSGDYILVLKISNNLRWATAILLPRERSSYSSLSHFHAIVGGAVDVIANAFHSKRFERLIHLLCNLDRPSSPSASQTIASILEAISVKNRRRMVKKLASRAYEDQRGEILAEIISSSLRLGSNLPFKVTAPLLKALPHDTLLTFLVERDSRDRLVGMDDKIWQELASSRPRVLREWIIAVEARGDLNPRSKTNRQLVNVLRHTVMDPLLMDRTKSKDGTKTAGQAFLEETLKQRREILDVTCEVKASNLLHAALGSWKALKSSHNFDLVELALLGPLSKAREKARAVQSDGTTSRESQEKVELAYELIAMWEASRSWTDADLRRRCHRLVSDCVASLPPCYKSPLVRIDLNKPVLVNTVLGKVPIRSRWELLVLLNRPEKLLDEGGGAGARPRVDLNLVDDEPEKKRALHLSTLLLLPIKDAKRLYSQAKARNDAGFAVSDRGDMRNDFFEAVIRAKGFNPNLALDMFKSNSWIISFSMVNRRHNLAVGMLGWKRAFNEHDKDSGVRLEGIATGKFLETLWSGQEQARTRLIRGARREPVDPNPLDSIRLDVKESLSRAKRFQAGVGRMIFLNYALQLSCLTLSPDLTFSTLDQVLGALLRDTVTSMNLIHSRASTNCLLGTLLQTVLSGLASLDSIKLDGWRGTDFDFENFASMIGGYDKCCQRLLEHVERRSLEPDFNSQEIGTFAACIVKVAAMRVACWVQLSSPRPEMAELLKAILLDPMRDFMLQMRRWQISQGFDIAEDPVYERTFGYSTYSIDLTRHGHIAPVLGGWLDSWSLKYNSSISEGESQSKARTGRSTRAQRLKGSNFHFWKVESGLDLKAFSEALNHEVLQELGKGAGQEGKDEAYSRKDEERDAGWLDLLTWYVTNWCQDAGAKRRTVECYWSASSPTRQLLILRDKTLRSALLSSKERSEILDPLLDADAFHIADVAPVDPLANWPKARMELIDDAEQLPGHVDVEDSREIKRKKLAVNGALILTKVLESLVRTGSITRSQFLLYCQLRAGTEPANFSGSVQDKLAMHLCEPGNCINFVKSSKLGGRTLEEVQEASMEPRRYGSRQWWYHLRKALKRGLISSGEIEKELLVLGKLYTEASKEENEGADAMALESATIRVSAALLRTARSATALEIAGRVLKNPDLSSWHRKLPLNPSLLTHLPVKEALLYLESVGHTIRDLAAEQERIRIREAEAREGSESEGIKLDKNPLKTSTSKAFIEFLSFSLESHLVDTKSLTKKLLEIYRTVSHHDIASAVVEKLHMMLKGCYLPSTSLTTTSQGEAGVSSLIWQALTSVAERAAEEHFSENRGVRVGSSLMFAKLAFLSHKYDPRSDPVPELSSRYLNQVIFAYIEKRIQLGERGLLRYVGRLESVGTEREARLRKAINLLSWPWELDLQLERWLIASLDSDSSRQYLTEIGFDLLKLKEGTIARQDESAFAEVASYLDEVRPSGWLQSLEAKLESYQERGGKHDAEAEPTTVPAVLMEDIRKKKSAFEANRIKERLRWNHLEYLFELYGQLIKDKYESLREATGTDQRVEQEIEANEEGVNKFRLVEQSIKNIIGVAARKPRAVEMADVDGQRGAAEGLRDFDKLSRRFNVEAIETNRFKDFTAQRLRSRIWEENHKRLLSQIKVQLEINTQAGYLLPPIRSKQAAADLAEAGSGGEEGSLSAGWGIESLRSQLRTEWYLLPWVRIVGPEGKRTGAEWKADEGDIEELAKKLLEFVHGSIVSKFERNAQAFLEVLSPVGFNQHVLVDLCRAMLDELERWKIDTGLRVRGTAKEERTKRSRRRLRMVQTVRSLEVFVHLLIKGWFEQDFKRVIERVKNPKAIEFVKGIKRDLEARMRESVAASTGRHLFADEEEEGGEQGDTEQEAEERERREEEKLNVELALIWHDVFSGVLGASPSRHESMW